MKTALLFALGLACGVLAERYNGATDKQRLNVAPPIAALLTNGGKPWTH